MIQVNDTRWYDKDSLLEITIEDSKDRYTEVAHYYINFNTKVKEESFWIEYATESDRNMWVNKIINQINSR